MKRSRVLLVAAVAVVAIGVGAATVSSNSAPSVDDASLSPSGGSYETVPVTLSADVSDPDMPDETVTVTFYVDGEAVDSKQIQSNQTVSIDVSPRIVGQHNWYVTATDASGATDTSATESFDTVSEHDFYNASSSLSSTATMEASTSHNVTYYWDNGTVDTKSHGYTGDVVGFDLDGEPAGEDFVAIPETAGYYSRPVWHGSLYQRNKTYMLPTNVATVNQTFTLRDYSGRFPASNSVLVIERVLADSKKHVMVADYFGSDGEVEYRLKDGARTCMRLVNTETGATDDLGCITPTEERGRVVSVDNKGAGNVSVKAVYVDIDPDTGSLPNLNDTTIDADIFHVGKPLDSYSLTINHSGSTLATKSGVLEDGETLTADVNLSQLVGETINVTVEWKTANDQGSVTRQYSVRKVYQNQFSLMEVLASVPARLVHGSLFTSILGLFATVVITGAVGRTVPMPTEGYAAVAVGSLALFGFIGWVGLEYALIGGLVFAAFAGLRRGI